LSRKASSRSSCRRATCSIEQSSTTARAVQGRYHNVQSTVQYR
jgi:hypothetical protein